MKKSRYVESFFRDYAVGMLLAALLASAVLLTGIGLASLL